MKGLVQDDVTMALKHACILVPKHSWELQLLPFLSFVAECLTVARQSMIQVTSDRKLMVILHSAASKQMIQCWENVDLLLDQVTRKQLAR